MMNVTFFQQLVDSISERGRELIGWGERGSSALDIQTLCNDLLSGRGEASGVALADEVFQIYAELDIADRQDFFRYLAESLNANPDKVLAAADAYRAESSPARLLALHLAAEPQRQELLRRLNRASGGTANLVRMRSDLLKLLPDFPELKVVDDDFFHLFSSWFNRGFLVLRRIDWQTPAALLEKIIKYEAVHEINDWPSLRRRLAPDRRCFGFFHPALVDEPLIFVEVALVKSIATQIQPLIDREQKELDPAQADTAVFYSISNCQHGLKGVSFGNFLIKQVVAELQQELPQLKHFVTLSPIPGFMRWLNNERRSEHSSVLSDAQRTLLEQLDASDNTANDDAAQHTALQTELLSLAAYYFLQAKTPTGKPLDPVARFHLGNGARLERINPEADLSAKGLRQSAGMMVNYAYVLADIERNHEAYANDNTVVTTSAVRKLLRSDAASATAK